MSVVQLSRDVRGYSWQAVINNGRFDERRWDDILCNDPSLLFSFVL